MTLFNGMSAFPITPASADGRVDTDGLCRLLDRLVAADVSSIGLLGSTGTYAYLTRAERKRAIDAAVDRVQGHVPLIVGIGSLRTDDAVNLACDAENAGADGLLMAPVSYTPLTQDEVYQHFCTVADATALPLCIYNNPGTTHFTFSTGLLERLAAVANISAVKMPLPSDGDVSADLQRLRTVMPDGFAIGYSADWGCADALLAGADTWYSVVGGILPEQAMKLASAAIAGETDIMRKLDQEFAGLWALFQEFGSLRVVYAIARLLALTDALPPRPILPIPRSEDARVVQALKTLGVAV